MNVLGHYIFSLKINNVQLNKLSQFGNAFQTKVLLLLLTDAKFLQTISDILTPDYFDSPNIVRRKCNEVHRPPHPPHDPDDTASLPPA